MVSIKALNEFRQKSVKKLASSAKSVCLICILLTVILLIWLFIAIAFANNSVAKINKYGDKRQPCLIPFDILKYAFITKQFVYFIN